MRLFIAVEMPDEVKQIFVALQKEIETEDAKLRFVKEFHLTLKFLGEVGEDKIDELKERLSSVSFEPFVMSLDDLGVFPSQNYIRVVWIGLLPEDKITELQKKVDESLEGMFSKEKDFKAHVTLARVKFVKEKQKFQESLNKIKVSKKTFKAESFKLIKSTLTGKGPIYEEIASF